MTLKLKKILPRSVLLMACALVAQAPASACDANQAQADLESPPAAKNAADLAHDALWEIFNRKRPEDVSPNSRAGMEFFDRKMREFVAAGRAFAKQYPADPRRHEALVQASYSPPTFIQGFKPGFDQAPGPQNIIEDTQMKKAFLEEQGHLIEQVIVAADATTRQRGGGFAVLIEDRRELARLNKDEADIEALQPIVDRVADSLGDERAMPVISQYVERLNEKDPAKARAYTDKLKTNPKLASALAADEKQKAVAAREADEAAKRLAAEIGTLKFTAADGRAVDLTKLRGKVVLIDFWATWCTPCIAELPNLRKVYEEYHDTGFEVVGITLERDETAAGDTKEQAAAKREASKRRMLEFAAARKMPWPQHFDGLHFNSPLVVRYGIKGIPAMFLLDKEGKVVTSQARGEKLEPEVRRLLGL